ncbi:hypothetical protein RUU25_06595 [Staphylococcus borealis]|uniref:hypothetical protein n=1 Tax=Staphylococcus borealis TaxID=2742203 RepID=UPI003133EA43
MEEKFEKILLDNTIFNKKEFMEKYNPWAQERATHLINNYLKIMDKENESSYFTGDFNYNSENFSWLAIEEELENKYLKTNKAKDFPKNIHYGLPNQIHGDIDKSTIFQCLLNPNIAILDNKSEPENLEDFFDEFESSDTGDLSATFSNYSNEKKIKKHIVDTESSMLSKELERLMKLEQSEYNEVMSSADNLKNKFYYLEEYFYLLLTRDINTDKVRDELKKELVREENYNLIKANIKKLKTCNLEVFPFRSKDPKLGFGNNNFGRDLVETEVDLILLGARVILRRIALNLQDGLSSNAQPIFIFRRYDLVWKDLIKTVLRNDYKVKNEDAKEMLKEMEDEYFYFLATRGDKGGLSGKVSIKNLKKSDNSVSKRQRNLTEEEFLNLKINHGTLILENNEE